MTTNQRLVGVAGWHWVQYHVLGAATSIVG